MYEYNIKYNKYDFKIYICINAMKSEWPRSGSRNDWDTRKKRGIFKYKYK